MRLANFFKCKMNEPANAAKFEWNPTLLAEIIIRFGTCLAWTFYKQKFTQLADITPVIDKY
jgi:hypothetical protein